MSTTAPTNIREFERWLADTTLPDGLRVKAERALMVMKMIAGNSPSTIEAMKTSTPSTWAVVVAELGAFAEAYDAWTKSRA